MTGILSYFGFLFNLISRPHLSSLLGILNYLESEPVRLVSGLNSSNFKIISYIFILCSKDTLPLQQINSINNTLKKESKALFDV